MYLREELVYCFANTNENTQLLPMSLEYQLYTNEFKRALWPREVGWAATEEELEALGISSFA